MEPRAVGGGPPLTCRGLISLARLTDPTWGCGAAYKALGVSVGPEDVPQNGVYDQYGHTQFQTRKHGSGPRVLGRN